MSKRFDTTRANCRDLETDLFYMAEGDLQAAGVSLRTLRRVCFDCPIQEACAKYGFKYEKYGTFGGYTDKERDLILKRQWNHKDIHRMLEQLAQLGVRLAKVVEYSEIIPEHIAPADWMKEGA